MAFNLIDKPDWKAIRAHLAKEGRVHKNELVKLITDTNNIFILKIDLKQIKKHPYKTILP